MRSAIPTNRFAAVMLIGLVCIGCSEPKVGSIANLEAAHSSNTEQTELRAAMEKIKPFFKPMGKPASYDWLASNYEPGQTFDEYLASNPAKPGKNRELIYILPLGSFSSEQRKLIQITSEFLEAFYDLPVKHMKARSLTPGSLNSRKNRFTNKRQFKTGYILHEVLAPSVPEDAAALIALTSEDLYSDDSMNFVFGQASFEKGVGVWSLDRLDDNTSAANFLIRTLKIAAHETGHMFSMRHCTKYECLMSGTNHLAETDRRPLDACPECTAKICWLSNVSFADRYERLAKLAAGIGLPEMAHEFEKKRRSVTK